MHASIPADICTFTCSWRRRALGALHSVGWIAEVPENLVVIVWAGPHLQGELGVDLNLCTRLPGLTDPLEEHDRALHIL